MLNPNDVDEFFSKEEHTEEEQEFLKEFTCGLEEGEEDEQ